MDFLVRRLAVATLLMAFLGGYSTLVQASCPELTASEGEVTNSWVLNCTTDGTQILLQTPPEFSGTVVPSVDGSGVMLTDMPPADGILSGLSSPSMGDGLASYVYGFSYLFDLSKDKLHRIEESPTSISDHFLVYVRHAAVELKVTNRAGKSTGEIIVHQSNATDLAKMGLQSIMYSSLWLPLQEMCILIEQLLIQLAKFMGPLAALLCLAFLIRLLTFPLSRWGSQAQAAFNEKQAAMKPALDKLNATYKGAEKSQKTVELYKQHDLKPLSGLKGSAPLLIQLPILIAVFNVTTESSLFQNVGFLWISDISLPDRIASLPFSIPVLGSGVNLFPLLLGAVGWWAGRGDAANNQSGLILHGTITVLCYSFAAAVLIYWVTTNLLQHLEKRMFEK